MNQENKLSKNLGFYICIMKLLKEQGMIRGINQIFNIDEINVGKNQLENLIVISKEIDFTFNLNQLNEKIDTNEINFINFY